MAQATNNNYEVIEKISNKIGETNVLIEILKKEVKSGKRRGDSSVIYGLRNYKRVLIEALEMIKEIDNNNY